MLPSVYYRYIPKTRVTMDCLLNNLDFDNTEHGWSVNVGWKMGSLFMILNARSDRPDCNLSELHLQCLSRIKTELNEKRIFLSEVEMEHSTYIQNFDYINFRLMNDIMRISDKLLSFYLIGIACYMIDFNSANNSASLLHNARVFLSRIPPNYVRDTDRLLHELTNKKCSSAFEVTDFLSSITVKSRAVNHTLLFLVAEPTDAARIQLCRELRDIQGILNSSRTRDKFKIVHRTSVRPIDISQAILDDNPSIVHFSGHGTCSGKLCFENDTGVTMPIEPEALADLFNLAHNKVECVVLNACYSSIQAKIISKYVRYVIGMKKEISDEAAIRFAVGFYQALGAGRSIDDAYIVGCLQIRTNGLPEHLVPTLITWDGIRSLLLSRITQYRNALSTDYVGNKKIYKRLLLEACEYLNIITSSNNSSFDVLCKYYYSLASLSNEVRSRIDGETTALNRLLGYCNTISIEEVNMYKDEFELLKRRAHDKKIHDLLLTEHGKYAAKLLNKNGDALYLCPVQLNAMKWEVFSRTLGGNRLYEKDTYFEKMKNSIIGNISDIIDAIQELWYLLDDEPIKQVTEQNMPTSEFRIAVLVPLVVELFSMRAFMSNIKVVESGETILYTGKIGKHNVVVASFLGATEYGNTNTSILLLTVLKSFQNIKCIFVVGIAGSILSTERITQGNTNYPRLGDLVVSKQIWRYDVGKLTEEGTQAILSPQKSALALANRVQAFFIETGREQMFVDAINKGLKHNADLDSAKEYSWVRPDDNTDILHGLHKDVIEHPQNRFRKKGIPMHFFEPIAVGDKVLKDATMREALANKGYFATEMESYGAFQVARSKYDAISIRSISDYSDGYKNDEWQPYAAMVSCAFVKCFLEIFDIFSE